MVYWQCGGNASARLFPSLVLNHFFFFGFPIECVLERNQLLSLHLHLYTYCPTPFFLTLTICLPPHRFPFAALVHRLQLQAHKSAWILVSANTGAAQAPCQINLPPKPSLHSDAVPPTLRDPESRRRTHKPRCVRLPPWLSTSYFWFLLCKRCTSTYICRPLLDFLSRVASIAGAY